MIAITMIIITITIILSAVNHSFLVTKLEKATHLFS